MATTDPFAAAAAAAAASDPLAGAANNNAGVVLPDPNTPLALEVLPSFDDPSYVPEELTAKAGDAFAEPPPPPDRIYRCKLSLRGVKQADAPGIDISRHIAPGTDTAPWISGAAKDKNGQIVGLYAKTIINVQIHDTKFPEYEGVYLQVPFKWMDTRLDKRGLSKIITILRLAGNDPSGQPWVTENGRYGHVDTSQSHLPGAMNIFLKWLQGEPEIFVRSEWSWNCEMCSQQGKQTGNYSNAARQVDGMYKFPQVKGVYSPELRCPVNPGVHGFSKARAMAVQYFSLDDPIGVNRK